MKRIAEDLPKVEIKTREGLRAWLSRNFTRATGVWVVTRNAASGGTVRWNDIVEEALCFGWIDSLPRKLDAERTMVLVTPRKPKSNWSAKNKRHVEDLERRGLMHEAGRAVVAAAKQNGAWSALDEVSALVVPPDLALALAAKGPARAHWDAFPPSARRGILEWISNAKTPPTRQKRVAETARLAKKNERANQWPRPKKK